MPEQVEDEFKGCLDLANFMLETLGLEKDVSYQFSKWDENNKEKYIGSKESWERTQNKMRDILNDLKIVYTEKDGEAAFYGPKLDIQIKNVHGKEDTLITIQIDFQLAERFGMTYTDSNGEKQYPIVLHRTSIGCYERTLALLIEKYAGALPTWLAPVQVKILAMTDRNHGRSNEIKNELEKRGIRVECDLRSEKIGFKIRESQMQKVPYMLIIGDKEEENNVVAVRSRKAGDIGTMALTDFIQKIREEIDVKAHD
jgi:threonyl-tRNA synthetase